MNRPDIELFPKTFCPALSFRCDGRNSKVSFDRHKPNTQKQLLSMFPGCFDSRMLCGFRVGDANLAARIRVRGVKASAFEAQERKLADLQMPEQREHCATWSGIALGSCGALAQAVSFGVKTSTLTDLQTLFR